LTDLDPRHDDLRLDVRAGGRSNRRPIGFQTEVLRDLTIEDDPACTGIEHEIEPSSIDIEANDYVRADESRGQADPRYAGRKLITRSRAPGNFRLLRVELNARVLLDELPLARVRFVESIEVGKAPGTSVAGGRSKIVGHNRR